MSIFKKLVILPVLLITFFLGYADAIGPRVKSYKIVNLPITKLIFVYREVAISLDEDPTPYFEAVQKNLALAGAISNKKAILFLDNGIDELANKTNYKTTPTATPITKAYLAKNYGRATLKTKRKVLLGYLVPPMLNVTPVQGIRAFILSSPGVRAFQSLDASYKPTSEGQENQSFNPTENDDGATNFAVDAYTSNDRIYDRITMMSYISGIEKNKTKFIGMMEIYDTNLNVYTFIALPGNFDDFVKENNVQIDKFPESANTTPAQQ